MAYGTVKVDNITFTNGGIDQTVTVSGIVQSISGNITATGTIQAATIIGTSTVSGATVTGNAGVFTTVTGGSAGFTTVTGTTVTGTTANFATLSGTTITGSVGNFGSGSAAAPSVSVGTTDNGIYSPGADQVAISTNGTGRLFVDAAGQIGVGTSTLSAGYGTGRSLNLVNQSSVLFQNASNTWNTATAGGAITYFSDNNLYVDAKDSASNIVFRVNGANERLRITSDGKLGLGTSAPSLKLTVADTNNQISATTGTNELIVRANSTEAALYTFQAIPLNFYTNNTARLTIDSSGRVGVGTTSPSTIVHCVGGASGVDTRITVGNNGASLQAGVDGSDFCFLGTNQNQPLYFLTNGTERARIDSLGRLLVGTSTASTTLGALTAKLQVQGTSVFDTGITNALWESSSNPAQLQLVKSRGASIGTQTVVQNNDNLGRILFGGSDGTDFETAAWIQCDVDGTPGANDMPGRLVFSTTADGASSPTERMRITSSGGVLVGTTSSVIAGATIFSAISANLTAQFGLSIATTQSSGTGALLQSVFNNTQVGSITNDSTSTAYNTSSDYRLKENTVPLTGAINRINQLQVHRFNFIADPSKTVDGFIAHEAQEVVPECVTGTKDEVDDEGNPVYQGIDQSKLVPLLTAALQEAIAKIESLEARLDAANL